MTTLFYAPPAAFSDGVVTLPVDEGRHVTRVLRHLPGDQVEVVDGVGGRHSVRLTEVRDEVRGEILSTEYEVGEPAHHLLLGLGLLKNANRFETFAEKAVELGVSEIVPLVSSRSERSKVRHERLQKILVAAMKQSGRSRLPLLHEPTSLQQCFDKGDEGLRLICHERSGEGRLADVLLHHPPEVPVSILIGPEGGFTEDEIASARGAGWRVVSLGPRRLRAETAAIAAASAAMLLLDSPSPNA